MFPAGSEATERYPGDEPSDKSSSIGHRSVDDVNLEGARLKRNRVSTESFLAESSGSKRKKAESDGKSEELGFDPGTVAGRDLYGSKTSPAFEKVFDKIYETLMVSPIVR
jgi:hypothetical protein